MGEPARPLAAPRRGRKPRKRRRGATWHSQPLHRPVVYASRCCNHVGSSRSERCCASEASTDYRMHGFSRCSDYFCGRGQTYHGSATFSRIVGASQGLSPTTIGAHAMATTSPIESVPSIEQRWALQLVPS